MCQQCRKQNSYKKTQRPHGDGESAGGEEGKINLEILCDSFQNRELKTRRDKVTQELRLQATRKTNGNISSERIIAGKQNHQRSCIPTAAIAMPGSIRRSGTYTPG